MLKIYQLLQAKVQQAELKLSQSLEQSLNRPYSSSVFYFGIIGLNVYLVFWQIVIDLYKFLVIIFADPGNSFNLFFRQRELRSCPFSYSNYKTIQRRVRMFSLAGVTAMVIVAVTTSVITNLLFGGKLPGKAATFSFLQSSWSTLDVNSSATHNTATGEAQQDWSKYLSKDQYLSTNGAGLSLSQTAGTSTQDVESDFLSGSFTTATTTGTGGVKMAMTASNISPVTTNGTSVVASPGVQGGWGYGINSSTTISGSGDNSSVILTNTATTPKLEAGEYFQNFGLKSDGTVWSWGYNGNGALGDGTATNRKLPVQVKGPGGAGYLTDVISIAGGNSLGYALKRDGTVYGWGNYAGGYSPVQVPVLTGIVAIDAGSSNMLAVKNDGTVWARVWNTNGLLGDGTAVNNFVSTPAQVPNLTGITAVSVSAHALALKNDGTVWAWGYNSVGQLGDNSTTTRLIPVQVSGLTGVTAISVGSEHSLALKSNGTVWAWGYNSLGSLGDNTTVNRMVPVQVSGLTGVTAISAGVGYQSLALKSDGTVWAWGANTNGQLGDNTSDYKKLPIQVKGVGGSGYLTGVSAISAGQWGSAALKGDGTVYVWGANNYGQYGNDTTVSTMTPTQSTMVLANLPSYLPLGTHVSYMDGEANKIEYNWSNFSFTQTSLNGSKVSYRVVGRPSTTTPPSAADFSSSPCGTDNAVSGGNFNLNLTCAPSNSRFLYYQATLQPSTDLATSPTLDSVTASGNVSAYAVSPASSYFTSASIFTGAVSSWDKLSWSSSGGQTITMKIRSGMSASAGLVPATSTFTIANNAGSDIWHAFGAAATPPVPSATASWGASQKVAQSSAISNDGGAFWETRLTDGHDKYDYQMYRFQNDKPTASTSNLTLTWKGWGDDQPGYNVYLYVWNKVTLAWEQLAMQSLPTPGMLSGSIAGKASVANYVDGSNQIYYAAVAKHYNYKPTVPNNTSRTPASGTNLGSVTTATLGWSATASTDADGDTPEYQAQLFSGAACAGGALQTRSYNTAASWNVTGLTTAQTYSWNIKARSSSSYGDDTTAGTCYSFSTGVSEPVVNGACNASTVAQYWRNAPSGASTLCSAGTPSAVSGSGPWTWTCAGSGGGTTAPCTAQLDTAGNGICGVGETCDYDVDCGACSGSCPLMYSWNGSKYDYQTDLQGRTIGLVQLNVKEELPGLYEIGTSTPENGKYKFKFREALPEADYFDYAQLWQVDAPKGYAIYTSWNHTPSWSDTQFFSGKPDNFYGIYTVKNPRAPLTAVDKNGDDVADKVRLADEKPVVETLDRANYYTVDFGKIEHPENAKLIIAGWEVYGKRNDLDKVIPRKSIIEVMNAKGEWEAVKKFGSPAGDMKSFVVDIANIWKTNDRRLRIHPAYALTSSMVIDQITFDDSAPVPVEIQKVLPTYADLHYRGAEPINYTKLSSRIHARDEVSADRIGYYLYGDLTKYGDVLPLLHAEDDQFAIFRHGDELEMEFPVAPQKNDTERKLFMFASVWYKANVSTKDWSKLDNHILPLPFNAMSKYPYDTAVENYPQDQEHLDYIKKWNTRVCEEGRDHCYDKNTGEKVAPQAIEGKKEVSFMDHLAKRTGIIVAWIKTKLGFEEIQAVSDAAAVPQAVQQVKAESSGPLKRSLNADYVELKITADTLASAGVNWAVSDFSTCPSTANGASFAASPCVRSGDDSVQYQATLSTANPLQTPALDKVDLTYIKLPATAQTLYSSYYNSGSDANLIGQLSWRQILNGGSVVLSMRSATSSAALTAMGSGGWLTPNINDCSTSGDQVTCSGTDIPEALRDLSGDQWFQYKVTLAAGGASSPVVNEVGIQYVVNKRPEFNPNFPTADSGGIRVYEATTTQAAAADVGKVVIEYQVQDPDGDDLGSIHPNQVRPRFQYQISGAWTDIDAQYLRAGDTDLKIVATSSYTTYSAIWDARAQLGTTTDRQVASIKVIVDDDQANGSAETTNTFYVDTKAPQRGNPVLVIKATSTIVSLAIQASDAGASFMKMRLATTSSAYGNFSTVMSDSNLAAGWENYAASKSYASGTSTVYVQFMDQYGNISQVGQVTPPAQPVGFMVQDTSNIRLTPTEHRLFMAWKLADDPQPSAPFRRYNIYRSTDGTNFNLLSSTTLAFNYYADPNLASTTVYYYKVATEDASGNLSPFSETIEAQADAYQNHGEGGGGSPTGEGSGNEAPVITGIATSSRGTTYVTISWRTDNQLGDSIVDYATSTANLNAGAAKSAGVPTMANEHEIVLSGLERGTQYFFRVKSTGPNGMTASSTVADSNSFTTLSGASINAGTIASSTANTSATITWTTTDPANSYVVYDTTSTLANSRESGDSVATTSHRVVLTDLAPGTTYWFFVKSDLDRADNGGQYYSFTTTNIQDVTAPAFTFEASSDIAKTYSSARVKWRTNEAATSTLRYATSSAARLDAPGQYLENTVNTENLNINHAFDLYALAGGTTYYLRLISTDAYGNTGSVLAEFATDATPDTAAPEITYITNPVIETSVNGVTINWQTNEDANSYVQYAPATTTNFAADLTEVGKDEATRDHTIKLLGLAQGQDYVFALKSVDVSENKNQEIDDNSGTYYTFRTLAGPEIDPESVATSTTDTTATISWATLSNADAHVIYSTSTSFSNSRLVGSLDKGSSEHEIILTELLPGKTYYVRIRSTNDAGGMTSYPADYLTLATGNTAPQIIGAVGKTITAMPSIIFSWLTDKAATSTISYYQEGQSGNVTTVPVGEQEPTTSHFFDLGGLLSQVKYYYKITLYDTAGNVSEITPEENNFEMPDTVAPVIASTTVMQTTPTGAIISWQTGEAATAYLQYSTSTDLAAFDASSTPAAFLEATSQILSSAPTISLSGLEQGTTYYYRVRSTDSSGNQSAFKYADDNQALFSFQTIAGPSINNVQVTPPTLSTTTVSWDTGASSTNAIVTYDTDPNFLSARQVSDMTYGTSHALVLAGLTPSTTYYYKVQSTDENGSATELSNEGQSFTTGTDSVQPTITFDAEADVVGLLNTSVNLHWTTDEPATSTVFYGTDKDNLDLQRNDKEYNFNLNHSFKLSGLAPDTTYYFKLVSTDSFGNRTEKSLNGSDEPLSFKTLITADTRPPVISNVRPVNTTVNSATIAWDTADNQGDPESASSFVQLATDRDSFDASFKEYGKDELVTSHTVTIDNLAQNQTYYYRVRSVDKNGNVAVNPTGSSTLEFRTNAGPVIPLPSVTATIATSTVAIEWQTISATSSDPVIADSYVIYDLSPDFTNASEQGSANLVSNHRVTLATLEAGQTYYYKVMSRDSSGGVTILADDSFQFLTRVDNVPPTIVFDLATDVVNVRDTQATINWQTNELAVARVNYGISSTSDPYSLMMNGAPTLNYSHSLTLTGLATSTTYYFRIISDDAGNNSASKDRTSDGILYSFTTLNSSFLTEDEAKAREETIKNQLDAAKAELDAAKAQLGQASSTSQTAQERINQLNSRIAELEKLNAQKGSAGGVVTIIDKTDKVAPLISEIQATDIKAGSVVINWRTDELANSFVKYGPSESYNRSFGLPELAAGHQAAIYDLEPATRYYYKVYSADASGNLTASPEQSFTTLTLETQLKSEGKSDEEIAKLVEEASEPSADRTSILLAAAQKAMEIMGQVANQVSLGTLETTLLTQFDTIEKLAGSIPGPLLGGAPTVVTGASTATISWNTDKLANSLIAYAPEGIYIPSAGDKGYLQVVGDANVLATAHTVRIAGLKPNTTYNYQLRSKAQLGPESKSRNFIFKTKEEGLEVLTHGAEVKDAATAIFRWSTNLEADTRLVYTPYRSGKLAVEEKRETESKTMTTMHEMEAKDLEAGVIYQIAMQSKDQKGRLTEEVLEQFTTSKDDLPPQITNVQTESALSQGKQLKVQTIVSWQTNEPTIGQVQYIKGVVTDDQEFPDKTTLETTYGRKHVAVVTKFDSGQVYTFRITATDSSGNLTTSKIYTILTPKQKESVFQLILSNFEDIFGWVGKVGN